MTRYANNNTLQMKEPYSWNFSNHNRSILIYYHRIYLKSIYNSKNRKMNHFFHKGNLCSITNNWKLFEHIHITYIVIFRSWYTTQLNRSELMFNDFFFFKICFFARSSRRVSSSSCSKQQMWDKRCEVTIILVPCVTRV